MPGQRSRTRIIRTLLCALIALVIAWPAFAAPPRVYPGVPCVIASEQPLDPVALLSDPKGFDCRHWNAVTGPFSYGLFRVDLDNRSEDPWELRHEYNQARAESVWVRYADGRIVKAPSDRWSARRPFSPGLVSYQLPPEPGRIVAVLVVIEGLQNQRGVAPGAQFETGHGALQSDVGVLALYGLLAGMVIALLVYNLALFARLRYRFILFYCISSLAMLGMGLSWSGGIFYLLPGLDTTTQVSLTMLFTALVLLTSSLFMLHFIEQEAVPGWLRRITLTIAMIGVASCVVRLIDVDFAWVLMDRITYSSIFATLAAVLVTAAAAALRGSRSARIYLVAWTVPILLALARTLWGVGFIGGQSTLVAMSPIVIMAFEALMSALAVTWRIGWLRDERDALRHFADTDPLTGLLNRRAFIARVQALGAKDARQRLIVIDVDRFKLVNDRYGHQAGDDVLIRVAGVLRALAPEGTPIGRIGGEEFALLVAPEPVDALPDRLCRAVEQSGGRDAIAVTISAGVADGPCADDADWRRLYYAADQALYRAKHGGRNRVTRAPEMLAA